MATINAELGRKDIISPPIGRYYVKYIWVLDETTKKPVRVLVSYEFSS